MRFSTIAFLLMFAGLFGHSRRNNFDHNRCEEAPAKAKVQITHEQARRIDHMKSELKNVDHQYRQIESSIRTLQKNVRSMQDVVRKAEKELCRCDSDLCRSVYDVRKESVTKMERELDKVVSVHRKLLAERGNLEVRRIALKARLELAEVGVDLELPAASADVVVERPSPLEALAHER